MSVQQSGFFFSSLLLYLLDSRFDLATTTSHQLNTNKNDTYILDILNRLWQCQLMLFAFIFIFQMMPGFLYIIHIKMSLDNPLSLLLLRHTHPHIWWRRNEKLRQMKMWYLFNVTIFADSE